jgi:hypothetical protein
MLVAPRVSDRLQRYRRLKQARDRKGGWPGRQPRAPGPGGPLNFLPESCGTAKPQPGSGSPLVNVLQAVQESAGLDRPVTGRDNERSAGRHCPATTVGERLLGHEVSAGFAGDR